MDQEKWKELLKEGKSLTNEALLKTNKAGEVELHILWNHIGSAIDYIDEMLKKCDINPKYLNKIHAGKHALQKADDFLSEFNDKHGVVKLK